MNKIIISFLLCILSSSQALATIAPTNLLEDFNAPFPTWESNWLGLNSNIENYYGSGATGKQGAGGLWITDGDGIRAGGLTETVEINFIPSFGSKLSHFGIDITTYVTGLFIQVFDISGNTLLNSAVPEKQGIYHNFSVNSDNGISGFNLFTNNTNQIEGNTGIDNVSVTLSSVPVPSAVWFLSSGLIGLLSIRKKVSS